MGILSQTILNPLLTAPILLLLTAGPENLRQPVLQQLQEHLSAATIGKAVAALKWLTVLGVGRVVHNALNVLASNNFRIRSEVSRYYWPNEIAVVTGAAGGFGRLMSLDFASRGINVIAMDVVEQLPADMQSVGKITYYKCDVTDREKVMELAETIKKVHGNPSILVNNAGIAAPDMKILTIKPETLNKIFGVNIISHYYMCQAFMPAMIEAKKGHIVTIASMASFASPAAMAPYNNTKAALISLHETLQQETRLIYKAPEIKFTIMHPAFADTGIIAGFKKELEAAKMAVMNPKIVSDAVVKQVLSCRGGQIILPESMSILSTMRAWPHYVTQSLLRLDERGSAEVLAQHAKNPGK